MSVLLICAAVAASLGFFCGAMSGVASAHDKVAWTQALAWTGLALIAAALYLAWRAGGAGA